MMRIGFGSDIHRLTEGKRLIIGGAVIDSTRGPIAHSDGDVLIHAVIDAILGAAALGDIGSRFPSSDEKWRDAESKELLSIVMEEIREHGHLVHNIDTVVHLETPRLSPYREEIRAVLAELLNIDISYVSVKAKTGEGVGPVGTGAAIAADAAVTLTSPEPEIWV